MKTTDRSCVIRLTKARVGIPGPAGERSVLVLQRGTLDVSSPSPCLRTNRRRTHRTRFTSSFAGNWLKPQSAMRACRPTIACSRPAKARFARAGWRLMRTVRRRKPPSL